MKNRNIAIKKAINCLGEGSQVELAKRINVSKAQVWQWLNNVNPIAIEKAIEIEAQSGGIVRCEDLRPDVNWSVLRNGK